MSEEEIPDTIELGRYTEKITLEESTQEGEEKTIVTHVPSDAVGVQAPVVVVEERVQPKFMKTDRKSTLSVDANANPSIKQLRNSLMAASCTKEGVDGELRWRSFFRTSHRDLGCYGIGIQLYFDFLVFLFVIFLLMGFTTLYSFYMSSKGEMLEEGTSKLALVSLANIGSCGLYGIYCNNQQEIENRPLFAPKEGESLASVQKVRDVTEMIAFLDVFAIVIFLFGALIFQYCRVRRVAKDNDDKNVTPGDFAIWVEGLPRVYGDENEHREYEKDLKNHFKAILAKCGPFSPRAKMEDEGSEEQDDVHDVTLCRDYRGAIGQFTELGVLQQEFEAIKLRVKEKEEEEEVRKSKEEGNTEGKKKNRSQKVLAKMKKLRDNLEKEVEETNESIKEKSGECDEDRPVVCAFVMFNEERFKDAVLNYYKWSKMRVFRFFQTSELRFGKSKKLCGFRTGNALKLRQAPEPSTVIFENLDFSDGKRRVRRCATCCLSVFVIFICTIIVVLGTGLQGLAPSSARERPIWVVANNTDTMVPGRCSSFCEIEMYSDEQCTSRVSEPVRYFDSGTSPDSLKELVSDGERGCSLRWSPSDCS